MHIVFLTDEYPQPNIPHGGVGTFVQTIARELIKNNIEVTVIKMNHTLINREENDYGVKVCHIARSTVKGLKWFFNSQKIQKKLTQTHEIQPIDIIEGPEMSFSFIRKIPNVKYLIRMHGGHHFFADAENRKINWWKAFQEKKSFNKADYVVGVSEYVMSHTSRYINFRSKNVGVVFNPANLNRFYKADITKAIEGRILFIGTICEKKGIRQLVQAMPRIKKKIPQAHLVIAGRDWLFPGTNESYTAYLKTFIDDSVKNSIEFLGTLKNEQLPIEIEKSQVCCLPSHMEAMPLAWIEVMSMGKPLVASNLGPGSELIQDSVTGLTCNPLDIDQLAEKVIYMLRHKEAAANMAGKARQFAIENFNLKNVIQKNIDLYHQIKSSVTIK